ncbi:metallopeptidase [Actinorhabdospora filicis]|uniref:Aminopeptidase N n=1 Tax=Actinorhabdospora filicis TaxID=1785913 RepID=A0A9W6SER2_9ACTN|nr:M1 family metallopeptidase [Actinorhabdospora filicis]GLZ75850.1 metallopeptidase [Actinorhabdospora filicis]
MPRALHRRALAAGLALAIAVPLAACQPDAKIADPTASQSSAPPPGPDYSAGRSNPVADPLYPDYGSADIDVLHYGLDLAWDPKARLLSGTATLAVRPVVAASQMTFDFDSRLKVSAVTVDGAAAQARQKDHDLVVPAAVTADKTVTVVITYAGEPGPADAPMSRPDFKEGVGATVEKDGALWTMQEPYGAFTWYPVNDHPSDEALYDFAITAPEGWTGVASGTYLGTEAGVSKWRSTVPVASYVTTIAVDEFELIEEKGPHDLPLTYWVPAEFKKKFEKHLRRSPEIIEWLEDLYGPYPFESAGVVVVGGESAMETQQMVTFSGDGAKEDMIEEVLAHEYAHQWFGDAISPRTWKDVWLNEGFAMYTEGLWVDKERKDVTEAGLWGYWRELDQQLRDKYGPPGDYKARDFAASNVYICPAVMLHELRKKMGGGKFDEMARDWVQTQKNSTQDRESFTKFVSERAGEDMSGFIDEWLDSKKTP